MSFKKIFLGLAACLFFLIPISSSGQSTATFSDVATDHPFVSTINSMKASGLVKGYPDGTFKPDVSISRAEFITIVMAAQGTNLKGANCFTDVHTEWFAKFVCSAKAKGLVKGYSDGSFRPANNINFAEGSTVIARANNFSITPAAASEKWYKPFVTKLEAAHAIPTSIDFAEKKLNRSETAEMIWRLKNNIVDRVTKTYAALIADFPSIGSCRELQEKVALFKYQQSKRMVYPVMYDAMPTGAAAPMEETSGAEPESAQAPPAADSSKSADYSQTNVQVSGVDEADVIKNDGEFIYLVTHNTVKIVKAFPPEKMSEAVSKLTLSDRNFTPTDLYVDNNKLIVIGSTYATSGPSYANYGSSKTEVFVLDMSDKSNVKEERSLQFDGYSSSSRRVGDNVYLVLSSPSYYLPLDAETAPTDLLPHFYDSRTKLTRPMASCSGVHFLPHYDDLNFLSVVSFNIQDAASPVKKSVVMGAGSGTVYASSQNLYVAQTQYTYPEVGVFDTLMQPDFAMPIWRGSQEKTDIFRFNLENGNVQYKDKGEVKGHLLNQFAMDEYGNAFRVVTHTNPVYGINGVASQKAANNLYVLNRDSLVNMLGKIENIAPGEDLHSVRFMGPRAYLVTFKQIDPFFALDVSDASNPKVLGELKIPGFSDYLHPFDENHIIGFGKEVDETIDADKVHSGDAVYYTAVQGMKIALFDVTDVANPKALFKEVIGERGTDSELLTNHRALLFDKARSLFAFPITVTGSSTRTAGPFEETYEYNPVVFQGAYVYTLDLDKGFQLKGKITNHDDSNVFKDANFYWYDNDKTIKRVVYISDYLYGISPGRVRAVKKDTVEVVNTLDLKLSDDSGGDVPPPEPLPAPGSTSAW